MFSEGVLRTLLNLFDLTLQLPFAVVIIINNRQPINLDLRQAGFVR
jgi:hypothetical protein